MREPGLTVELEDEAATTRLGALLAETIPQESKEMLLTLQGELGAGKTSLARALIRCLGAAGPVRSPTYTLVEPYDLPRGRVLHLDLYRLSGGEELDLCAASLLALVEWPERAGESLGTADVEAELSYAGSGRRLRLRAGTPGGQAWLDGLARRLGT
jgi:tRNA threonylcarbamoyladenosine biosynthesis protein TsaE